MHQVQLWVWFHQPSRTTKKRLLVSRFFKFGLDIIWKKVPLFCILRAGKQTPGDILNNMRKSGAKDLDITFVGMGFIIHAAITIVKNSVSVARQIQIPNVFWIIMPWKVMKQNKIGEQLITFMDAIDKYNSQLQVSISVASYAVNLKQLENALNATSMLVSEEMK